MLCLFVISRFDGEEIKTDETIRTLAQKWQPTRRPRSEERNTKAVDTDMIVVSCVVSCCVIMCYNCLKHYNLPTTLHRGVQSLLCLAVEMSKCTT